MNKIYEIQRKIYKLEQELREEAKRLYPDLTYWHVIGNIWECKKSPFGRCVYNNVEDSVHDYCIFCGQPEERK